ncbi:MAG: endonuclease/exonuclease/phosphatase family protein [Gammaproteobacteria bacterium]|nr:endonuclease/exonuclease/phosphatase family protein [Gammaproteobacteria bacterium]
MSNIATSTTLRILSYNLQVGIKTSRPSHYFTGSWKHLIPHSQRLSNLDDTINFLEMYDIVGLQETDAGSLRSNYINLTEYLADRARFPHWYHQVNRNLGHIAKHSNGLLSRLKPYEIENIKLPGLIPGRQAILAKYGTEKETLAVFVLHLALSKRARLRQLAMISEKVNQYEHAIVMGDLNCKVDSAEMRHLFSETKLHEPLEEVHTFPSWRPQHHIDHILVTSELEVVTAKSLKHACSDHLPIMMEVKLPETLKIKQKPLINASQIGKTTEVA